MPRRHAIRARAVRSPRWSVESLEGRQLMAELSLVSATVRPDGRIVELVFSGPRTEPTSLPDWTPAAAAGRRLVTAAGVALEPLGTVVDTSGDTLTWTSTFLVPDPSQVITFDAGAVTLTGPARLFDDGANWTAALDVAPARNDSLVDANGFTTNRFTRGAGGVTIYVSSRYGNDSRGLAKVQNPATPLQSLKQAFALLKQSDQDGRGAAIRLLRGDVFAGAVSMTVSGQDREHPFVLEDYWHDYGDGRRDPGARPIIRSDMRLGQADGLIALTKDTVSGVLDHIVIRRVQIDLIGRSAGDRAGIGIKAWTAGRNWVIDDCVIDEFRTGVAIDDYHFRRFSDVMLLRTIITDSHAKARKADVKTAKSQGLFVKNVDGLLVSQSTLDRNGRVTSNYTGRNIYSHNIYIQRDCGQATVWGNVIRGGGSHGIQLRPGGILAYNYFARNAIGGFVRGGAATRNIVELAENLGSSSRGWGLGISAEDQVAAASLEFNFIVNTLGNQPRALFTVQSDTDGILNGVVRNNTIVRGGYVNHLYADPTIPHAIRVDANLNVSGSERSVVISQNGPWHWYASNRNLWRADDPDRTFAIGGGEVAWAEWVSRTGTEQASIRTSPSMVNDRASIADYAGRVGSSATEDHFVSRIRTRRSGTWSAMGDANAIYQFFASQYQPTNLSALGSGATPYYGAVDYR